MLNDVLVLDKAIAQAHARVERQKRVLAESEQVLEGLRSARAAAVQNGAAGARK